MVEAQVQASALTAVLLSGKQATAPHRRMHSPVVVVAAGHRAPLGAPLEQTTETSTSSALHAMVFVPCTIRRPVPPAAPGGPMGPGAPASPFAPGGPGGRRPPLVRRDRRVRNCPFRLAAQLGLEVPADWNSQQLRASAARQITKQLSYLAPSSRSLLVRTKSGSLRSAHPQNSVLSRLAPA